MDGIVWIVVGMTALAGAYWIGGKHNNDKRDRKQRDDDAKTMATIRGAVDPNLSDDAVADSLRDHAK